MGEVEVKTILDFLLLGNFLERKADMVSWQLRAEDVVRELLGAFHADDLGPEVHQDCGIVAVDHDRPYAGIGICHCEPPKS